METRFKGNFGYYQVRITEDGHPTLWSEAYEEGCHSREGAAQETDLYYIQGCRLGKRIDRYNPLPFSLLEIGHGFGLGYERTITYLSQLPTQSTPHFLFYLAIEKDESIVKWGQVNLPSTVPEGIYPLRSSLQEGTFLELPCLRAAAPQGELIVLIGEARSLLLQLRQQLHVNVHAIYQDAFSPLKNPELWTVEWFSNLKAISHPECVLSTFSASSRVRKGLIEAGWIVKEGERFGPKRASTVATLQGESSVTLLQKLERSPVLPLRNS